jgi:hypothetical protein
MLVTNSWLFGINTGVSILATLIFIFVYYCHYREVREGRMRLQKDLVFPGAFTVEAQISNKMWLKALETYQRDKTLPSPNLALIKLIEDHYDNLNREQTERDAKNLKVACVKLELAQSEEVRLLKIKASTAA